MKRKWHIPLFWIPVVLTVTGCVSLRQGQSTRGEHLQGIELTAQTRADFEAFDDFFEARILEEVSEIERRSANREYRRAATLWRTQMVPACQELTHQKPSPEAVIELWLLCQQQFDYLDTGRGATLFGPHQAKVVSAAEDILRQFEKIPRKLMSPENFEQMQHQIQSSALAHPMTGEFLPASKRGWEDSALVGMLRQITSVPMTPLNALRGIGKAPDSVLEVSAAVDRFTAVTEDLPINARWQLKLLATELAEHDTVAQTVDGLTRIADGAEEFNQTLAGYPAQIAAQAQSVLNDAVARLPAVQETLADARELVEVVRVTNEGFRGTLADSERLLDKIRETSGALTETAGAVRLTSQEILKFIPASKQDETGPVAAQAGEDRAFSFQAVTESAVALQSAAHELLPVLAEVRGIIAQQDGLANQIEQAGARLDASLERAATRLEKSIDRAAWRAFQLLAAAFAMLGVYRVVVSRKERRTVDGR